MRILIIEDEPTLAKALKQGLENEQYEVKVADTGEEGFFLVHTETFDLMILDLMLPGCDGLEALTTLRSSGLRMPVLIVSARDTLEDRVLGLDAGADDYLVKPFAFAELLARVRALLRRGHVDEILSIKAADLELDRVAHKVTRGGEMLNLTGREYELLEYLLLHQDQTVSREMLARDVWREVRRATPLDNVIDVHMAHLRKKVDGETGHKLIHTLRGVGFILSEEAP
jgi:DNA-binding response OmpR family regulator